LYTVLLEVETLMARQSGKFTAACRADVDMEFLKARVYEGKSWRTVQKVLGRKNG
jgi:hypothetical protein